MPLLSRRGGFAKGKDGVVMKPLHRKRSPSPFRRGFLRLMATGDRKGRPYGYPSKNSRHCEGIYARGNPQPLNPGRAGACSRRDATPPSKIRDFRHLPCARGGFLRLRRRATARVAPVISDAMRSIHAPQACITDKVCITHEVRIVFRKERITQRNLICRADKSGFFVGADYRTRTCDLMRVKHAL